MKWKFWVHDTPPALRTTYINTFEIESVQFLEDANRNSGKVVFRVIGDDWKSDRFTVEVDPRDKSVMFGTPDATGADQTHMRSPEIRHE